jgi:hypothetical protein
MTHLTTVERFTGDGRWRAACSCGWVARLFASRSLARGATMAHRFARALIEHDEPPHAD